MGPIQSCLNELYWLNVEPYCTLHYSSSQAANVAARLSFMTVQVYSAGICYISE